jgi:hypothetical protein
MYEDIDSLDKVPIMYEDIDSLNKHRLCMNTSIVWTSIDYVRRYRQSGQESIRYEDIDSLDIKLLSGGGVQWEHNFTVRK